MPLKQILSHPFVFVAVIRLTEVQKGECPWSRSDFLFR